VHGVNPDGQSFTLFASMDISCDGALPAKLNAADLTFSYQGTPVGYATLPPISFEAGSNTINTQVDELFTLYDETLEGWNAFAHDLIREDSVRSFGPPHPQPERRPSLSRARRLPGTSARPPRSPSPSPAAGPWTTRPRWRRTLSCSGWAA
jgi:hypothetical protein